MSKIERGDRNASRDQVAKIAKFLKVEYDELLTLWLADKVGSVVEEEKVWKTQFKELKRSHPIQN